MIHRVLPEIWSATMCRQEGGKTEVQCISHGFGFIILHLYHENNPPKIKLLEKNTLVPSYSRDLIALKMCRKVTFGHSLDNNL